MPIYMCTHLCILWLKAGTVQEDAVCCSVLQCLAVCCSVLQCVAVCCSVLQCVTRSSMYTLFKSAGTVQEDDANFASPEMNTH